MNSQPRWAGESTRRDSNSSSSQNSDSDRSYRTQSTTPTEYSRQAYRPGLPRPETCYPRLESLPSNDIYDLYDDPKGSIETYVSTIPSDDEASYLDADDSYEALPTIADEEYRPEALPSTPRDFAQLFPSSNRISIRHDDATLDGNMNLRLDTQVEARDGTKQPMTLFHLRMHDLRSRDFSLRRYCRDSGREVCHSTRKYHESLAHKRPGIQRSLTSALAPLFKQSGSNSTLASGLQRTDSGYGSIIDPDEEFFEPKSTKRQSPTNTIKLEFSNYAHVDVTRLGAKSSKRYEFEYWGTNYAWKRHEKQDGEFVEVSFHLFRQGDASPLAHIVPVPLTTAQAEDERLKGGWVAPCSLWIRDEHIIESLHDVADVVVATGLMALVDDSIIRRWPAKRNRQFIIPLPVTSSIHMEYVGPKRLIDEVFHRTAYPQPSAQSPQYPGRPRRTTTA